MVFKRLLTAFKNGSNCPVFTIFYVTGYSLIKLQFNLQAWKFNFIN